MQNLFKPVFKLNADAPAPGTTGPRPAEGLACARRRTGGRASVCKTLAKPAAFELPRLLTGLSIID